VAGDEGVRVFVLVHVTLGAVSRPTSARCARTDLRDHGDVGDCHDHRDSGRTRHCDLLAGIPSIIYGMWGFFVLGPFMADTFQPFMIKLFNGVPVLGAIFAGPPSYLSLFNAALILAIMVLPFITAISVDVFKTVPPVLKEAAYGVGCTTWEVVRNVVIPYTRVGVIGGIMLALGRALGETMAVTFIIGNSFRISWSVFAPGTTISAAIASEFAESEGLHQSALILLGLLLFVLTFFVLAAARLMLMRLEKKAGN
jgi:phosphate transport system permease protein